MRVTFTILVVLIATNYTVAAHAQSANREISSDEVISCTVSIFATELKTDAKNEIEITIRNTSTENVAVNSLSVYLSPAHRQKSSSEEPIETAYMAPVNLYTKGALEAKQKHDYTWQYPTTSMGIPGTEVRTFRVDLSSLLWGRFNSSQLPSQRITSLEAGEYELFAVLRAGEKNKVTSNHVFIALPHH